MNVLLTGINGFLGSSLAVYAKEDNNHVIGLVRERNHKTKDNYLTGCTLVQGDLMNLDLLKRIVNDYEVDLIYHLAAQSIVKLANTNPKDAFLSNVIGTVNVLEAVRQVNPKIKVVCASSDKAYGVHDELPYLETMDVRAGDPYSTSKACGDLVAQSYAKTYGLNVNIIRSANIYGYDLNLSRIIPNTITRILKGKMPVLYSGVMDFKREFIHVSDVCSAYDVVAKYGKQGEAYNIGDDTFHTIGDVVEMICELMVYGNKVKIEERPFKEIPFQYLDADKLKALGWEKTIALRDGLEQTINEYRRNFN
jgi:CDP-glucose 4,6-dehydratase